MRQLAWLLAAVIAGSTIVPAAAGPSDPPVDLLGTWVLVEQTYGNGESNLVDKSAPIRLRIALTATGQSLRVWQGEAEASGADWPAMVADGRLLRATSRTVRFGSAPTTLEGRYEVVPVEGEDLVLDVRETYSLSADRKSLVGTVAVRFLGGDKNRGGYTLHRRFEREP